MIILGILVVLLLLSIVCCLIPGMRGFGRALAIAAFIIVMFLIFGYGKRQVF